LWAVSRRQIPLPDPRRWDTSTAVSSKTSASAVRGIKTWALRNRFVLRVPITRALFARAGYQSSCQHAELVGGATGNHFLRVPLADGTLCRARRDVPTEQLIPSLLALSDVMGTGWFAADAARVKAGHERRWSWVTAQWVCWPCCPRSLWGAERIIAMSRHEVAPKTRPPNSAQQTSCRSAAMKAWSESRDMTKGIGADAVMECVGTQQSMLQAIRFDASRAGYISYVGVSAWCPARW